MSALLNIPSCCVQGQIYLTFMYYNTNSLSTNVAGNIQWVASHDPRNIAEDDVRQKW
jgi:hypothetical protein